MVKKEDKKKAGVMQLPFNMIFSIMLIVLFIVIAIIVINHFLNLSRCSQINLFVNDLQNQIDEVWKSQKSSVVFSATLPKKIKYVCFANLNEEATTMEDIYEELKRNFSPKANLYFYPQRYSCQPYREILHINITELDNPYCIENKGKVEIKLQKDFFYLFVKIEGHDET